MSTSVGSTAPESGLQITSAHRYVRQLEFIYAVVALFFLTQGPVYRLWGESAARLDTLPLPSIGHAHFATFILVQTPGVLLWARRVSPTWLASRANQLLTCLHVWLGLSVVWSTFARQSIPEYVALVFTSVFGLYLATSFTPTQFWAVVASATAIGLAFSSIAIIRLWDGAVNLQEDYWIGIYYNRNSLAPVAAVALLAALGILCIPRGRFVVRDSVERISALGLALLALLLLFRSESQTSVAALLVAGALVSVWLVSRRILKNFHYESLTDVLAAPLALLLVGGILGMSLRVVAVSDRLASQTSTFNSRSSLWSLSWSGFLEKPLHGWGWMAAWHTPDFFKQGIWWSVWQTGWSHSSYFDLLLGGGLLAGLLGLAFLLVALAQLSSSRSRFSVPQLALAGFVLTAATQESFFVGSHFLWALLIASLVREP